MILFASAFFMGAFVFAVLWAQWQSVAEHKRNADHYQEEASRFKASLDHVMKSNQEQDELLRELVTENMTLCLISPNPKIRAFAERVKKSAGTVWYTGPAVYVGSFPLRQALKRRKEERLKLIEELTSPRTPRHHKIGDIV